MQYLKVMMSQLKDNWLILLIFIVLPLFVAIPLIAYYKMKKQTIGERNNNPLNIRKTSIAWQGEKPTTGSFEVFDTLQNGFRAGLKNILTHVSRGSNTIPKLVAVWAPPTENDTKAYIFSVLKTTGLPASTVIDKTNIAVIAQAMALQETGKRYDLKIIQDAQKLI